MIHYAVAFGLLLHVLFWGAGAAVLLLSRPLARFWPILTVPAGLGLQSAGVWIAAHLGVGGTNSYVWWTEAVPTFLLIEALARHGVRRAWTDVARIGLVWSLVAGCLTLLVLPVAIASK